MPPQTKPLLGARAVTAATAEERRLTEVISTVLRPMLASEPQMVHFPTVARAALDGIDGLPRVPLWRGLHVADGPAANAAIDLDEGDPARPIMIGVAPHDGDGRSLLLDITTARALFLAGLAACDAAEDPSRMIRPDCDSTSGTDTLDRPDDNDSREDGS